MRCVRRHRRIVYEQSITWVHEIWLSCEDSSKSGCFVRSDLSKTGYFKGQLVKNGEDCGEGFGVCDYLRLMVDLGELVKICGRERLWGSRLLKVCQDSWT